MNNGDRIVPDEFVDEVTASLYTIASIYDRAGLILRTRLTRRQRIVQRVRILQWDTIRYFRHLGLAFVGKCDREGWE
jgi:hypothetical protein